MCSLVVLGLQGLPSSCTLRVCSQLTLAQGALQAHSADSGADPPRHRWQGCTVHQEKHRNVGFAKFGKCEPLAPDLPLLSALTWDLVFCERAFVKEKT